jgi:hypothetical protein
MDAINSPQNTLIVEVNPEPVLEVGNVKKLIGRSEALVPALYEQIVRLQQQNK